MAVLEDIRADVETLLSSTTALSDAEIDKAVDQAVAVLSRQFPREVVAQTVYNEDVTLEAWTAVSDTAVTLANKPIRFNSEEVIQSGTTFVKDTDYEIDYVNGTITMLSTGGMSAASATITYKMDGTMIDISSLLTEPISIDQVDVIRNDRVPSEYESWMVHGDFLTIISSVNQSQMRFLDNDHIRIYYLAQHVEPIVGTAGSYPAFLDEVVLIGVTGYGLLIEAVEQEHLAITDLASARTSIGNIAAVHTAIGTVVTALAVAQSDANVALDAAAAELVIANTEIDKSSAEAALANTELDKVDTAGGGVLEAETELALIIIALATGGDFDTALDKVIISATTDMDTALDAVTTEADKGATALVSALAELVSSTRNADNYLLTGEALINKTNIGRNAPENNQQYANTKVSIAQTLVAEANGRYAHAQILIQEASQRFNQAQAFIQEASGRLRAVEDKLQLVQGWLSVSGTHISSAQGYIQVAQTYQTAGERYINNGLAYIQEAAQRLSAVIRYVEEINSRLGQIRAYLDEAATYQVSATSQRESAALFRVDGNRRISEFLRALSDSATMSTHPRISSVRQYSSDSSGQRVLSWTTF